MSELKSMRKRAEAILLIFITALCAVVIVVYSCKAYYHFERNRTVETIKETVIPDCLKAVSHD